MKRRFIFCMMLCCLLGCGLTGRKAYADETEMPMLVPCDKWYDFTVARSNIQSVEFRDTYIPDGTEVGCINGDVNQKGDIKVYLLAGRKRVIIAGNGSGGILANENCIEMFKNFKGLLEVRELGVFNVSKVRCMDSMFDSCMCLELIDPSSFNTSSVESMCSMFQNCSCIEHLDLSRWDLSRVKDTSYMFYNCAALQSIDIPQMTETSIENMAYMFAECYELKDPNLHGLKTGKATNMTAMFRNCVSLQDPDLSFLDTKKLQNGYMMFEGCTGLKRLNMHPMDAGSIPGGTAADFFGNGTYPELLEFYGPVNVCVDAPMPDPGNCSLYRVGEKLTLLPRNGINEVSCGVECEVTFQTDEETIYDTIRVPRGANASEPEPPIREPDDAGSYTFDGWYLHDVPYDFAQMVSQDTILTAAWVLIPREPEEEPETSPETEPEMPPETEPETPPETEPETPPETEPETPPEAELETPPETEPETPAAEDPVVPAVEPSDPPVEPTDPTEDQSGIPEGASKEQEPSKPSPQNTGGGSTSSGGSSGSSFGSYSFSSGGRSPSAVTLTVAGTVTYSRFWYADTSGAWRVRDNTGKNVTSAWLCDDAVAGNGKNVWYLINADGTMVSNGLIQDRTGNYYSLETTHNGYYGMLRYKNGFYKCGSETLFITFNHEHNGSFGAITSPEALEALKRIYGVTQFAVGNENIRYTSSF